MKRMEKRETISVIVPCYNEEASLPRFYRETKAVLQTIDSADYEMVFVDDGSTDQTLGILRRLADEDSRCRYVSFSRNFGKEAGMYAGLSEASGDYCVIMDADLQHPPALLVPMYQAVHEEGYDCCGGKRCGRDGDGAVRSLCSRLFYKIGKKLTHMDMSDGYGDFRMMNRAMTDAVLKMKEYNRYMKGIYSFVGFQTKWIEFENVERTQGESKWSFRSLLSYAGEGIFAFSAVPLKAAGIVGGLLLAAALVLLLLKLAAGIFRLPLADFSGIGILLIFLFLLSGLQMLFLYIIGIYLSKDCLENKKRPIYIVREKK